MHTSNMLVKSALSLTRSQGVAATQTQRLFSTTVKASTPAVANGPAINTKSLD